MFIADDHPLPVAIYFGVKMRRRANAKRTRTLQAHKEPIERETRGMTRIGRIFQEPQIKLRPLPSNE